MKKRATEVFAANFVAGLAVLFALKYALVINNIWGTEGFEPAWQLLPKSLLLLGWDVVGALLLATLVAGATLPLLVWRGGRGAAALAVVLQTGHAFLAAFSFFCLVFQGGPLNKQAIDAGLLEQAGEVKAWLPALWESFVDYLTPANLGLLGFVMGLGAAAVLLGPGLVRRLSPRARGWGLGLLALFAVVTVGLLPFLQRGYFWSVRLKTYDMEYSPTVELPWSYVKPVLRSFSTPRVLEGDQFRLDLDSRAGTGMLPAQVPNRHPVRTNVLMVLMESVGSEYLDVAEEPMPFLNALRAGPGAVSLERYYTTWSLTSKAIFSLLCSELPYPNFRVEPMVNPAIPCRSLPEVLHAAGYFTAFVTSQDFAWDRLIRFIRHREFDVLWDMLTMPGHETAWTATWGVDDRVTVRNVLDLAARKRDRPFFIVYGMFAGHHPYMALPEHEACTEENRRESYLRAIRVADDRLRDLFAGLEERGLRQDTLVVLVSDHGEGHGRRAGRNVYEVVVRVPAVFIGPQLEGENVRVTATTSHLDLAPTILGLVGLEPPCTMKGRDLTRPAEGAVALFGGRPPRFQIGLADGRWKFILEDLSEAALYDLDADPGEDHNVAMDHPDLAAQYRRMIEEYVLHSENLIERYVDILAESGCKP